MDNPLPIENENGNSIWISKKIWFINVCVERINDAHVEDQIKNVNIIFIFIVRANYKKTV